MHSDSSTENPFMFQGFNLEHAERVLQITFFIFQTISSIKGSSEANGSGQNPSLSRRSILEALFLRVSRLDHNSNGNYTVGQVQTFIPTQWPRHWLACEPSRNEGRRRGALSGRGGVGVNVDQVTIWTLCLAVINYQVNNYTLCPSVFDFRP